MAIEYILRVRAQYGPGMLPERKCLLNSEILIKISASPYVRQDAHIAQGKWVSVPEGGQIETPAGRSARIDIPAACDSFNRHAGN